MVSNYERYQTVRFKASYYNFAEALADPDSAYFKIWNNTESSIIEEAPTKSATGKYYYDCHMSCAVGQYVGEFTGELDSSPARTRFRFRVLSTQI